MKSIPKYKDESLSFEERAKDLVSRMTIDECVSQMLFQSAKVERLGIQYYNWWNEALHGVARSGMATVFPQAIGLAATFDDGLIYKVADVIST
ncbi:MAG TPA: glycosyl hydrolase, partial [Clostridiaceae bacterium]|nr:glycosyl hydrolase [Clostridiaceae bacterium]